MCPPLKYLKIVGEASTTNAPPEATLKQMPEALMIRHSIHDKKNVCVSGKIRAYDL